MKPKIRLWRRVPLHGDQGMSDKQEIIYYLARRLMFRMMPLMPYGFPSTRWKRFLSAVFWGIKPKYDFTHGNIRIGDRLIHKHIPMVLLNNFKVKYWGFGLVWENGDWVHYSFAYHPPYRSFIKAWKTKCQSSSYLTS